MKKVLVVFTFLGFWLFSHTVSAQIRNAIIVGASASQIDGDREGGFDKAGLVFGGSSNFKINDKFSFQPEILWLQKGSKSDTFDIYNPNAFYKWRLNYISIPVLLNYQIQQKFTLQAGFTADYLIDAKVDAGNGFTDRTDELQKFDLNYAGGLEYKISHKFSANARYQYSVKWLDNLHFKNSNVVVTLRYYLGDGA